VGREIEAPEPYTFMPSDIAERGSIIVVVATDAPLLPHQLKRLARRVPLGLGRNGSISGNGSGDLFIAFSTANKDAGATSGMRDLRMLPNDSLDVVFGATVARHRRGDCERDGGGQGYDRGRWSPGHRHSPPAVAGSPAKIQPLVP